MPDQDFTLKQQISAVHDEIAMRRRVYARWVKEGRMGQAAANERIAVMEAVLRTLSELVPRPDAPAQQAALFQEQGARS